MEICSLGMTNLVFSNLGLSLRFDCFRKAGSGSNEMNLMLAVLMPTVIAILGYKNV